MKCSICGKEIVLVPSAAERAKKFGGKAADYTKLFTTHADCALAKRKGETSEFIRKHKADMALYLRTLASYRHPSAQGG